jgi:hypothetical protein
MIMFLFERKPITPETLREFAYDLERATDHPKRAYILQQIARCATDAVAAADGAATRTYTRTLVKPGE